LNTWELKFKSRFSGISLEEYGTYLIGITFDLS
jgi:hypothetical protein